MLPGRDGKQKVGLNEVFEAVGAVAVGQRDESTLAEMENTACPGCGSCSGMYTANSMNCLTETIGLALPATAPFRRCTPPDPPGQGGGERVMELLRQNIRVKVSSPRPAFENALRADMAIGCSSNTVLHLLAVSYAAGCRWI